MRVVVLVVVVLVGCGRFGFAPIAATTDAVGSGDAARTVDAPDGPAMFVQGAALPLTTAGSASLAIAKTTGGDLLVIGITQESGTTAVVAKITDDQGNTYVSANQRSVDTSCANTAEIWYAAAVRPDASSVTVTMSASVTIEVWALEVSGLGPTPLDTGAVASTQASSGAMISAPPVATTTPGELVISTVTTCGAVSQIQPGNPFTALAIENGEDTAYDVAAAPGTYAAVWSYGGGSWNASTAAFH